MCADGLWSPRAKALRVAAEDGLWSPKAKALRVAAAGVSKDSKQDESPVALISAVRPARIDKKESGEVVKPSFIDKAMIIRVNTAKPFLKGESDQLERTLGAELLPTAVVTGEAALVYSRVELETEARALVEIENDPAVIRSILQPKPDPTRGARAYFNNLIRKVKESSEKQGDKLKLSENSNQQDLLKAMAETVGKGAAERLSKRFNSKP